MNLFSLLVSFLLFRGNRADGYYIYLLKATIFYIFLVPSSLVSIYLLSGYQGDYTEIGTIFDETNSCAVKILFDSFVSTSEIREFFS